MTKPILTQEQAEAIYIAGTALQPVRAMLDTVLEVSVQHEKNICVWQRLTGQVKVAQGTRREQFDNWTAFADFYAAAYGLTIVERESIIDRMVREAKMRLERQLNLDVRRHTTEIKSAFIHATWVHWYRGIQNNDYDKGLARVIRNSSYGKNAPEKTWEDLTHQFKDTGFSPASRHPLDEYGFTLPVSPHIDLTGLQ